MTKQEMRAAIEAAMKSGNAPAVKVIKQGECAIDIGIRHCRCGCRGDYTEHTMRLGERGIFG